MNWDQLAGQWKQMTAQVKSKWAKLTDNDIQNLAAKKDALVGKIQERYGILKEDAERQVDDWVAGLSPRHGQDPPMRQGGHNPQPPKQR